VIVREETQADLEAVAHRAARIIADAARRAVVERGHFLLATSGGATPWRMLRLLADQPHVPWAQVHLFQVDERVAPENAPERNMTNLKASLLDHLASPPGGIHPMPVERVAGPGGGDGPAADDEAASLYEATLTAVAGAPAVLDLVHLGLGDDGHTASLVPGDPALDVASADVAVTGLYRGYRRMTLTLPVINRARSILWVVAGAEKGQALAKLRGGDTAVPAGRVRRDTATIVADAAADRAARGRD